MERNGKTCIRAGGVQSPQPPYNLTGTTGGGMMNCRELLKKGTKPIFVVEENLLKGDRFRCYGHYRGSIVLESNLCKESPIITVPEDLKKGDEVICHGDGKITKFIR
ncbi:MAG: hypothetical protein V3U75_13090 [Methylococcaceae bacterium]